MKGKRWRVNVSRIREADTDQNYSPATPRQRGWPWMRHIQNGECFLSGRYTLVPNLRMVNSRVCPWFCNWLKYLFSIIIIHSVTGCHIRGMIKCYLSFWVILEVWNILFVFCRMSDLNKTPISIFNIREREQVHLKKLAFIALAGSHSSEPFALYTRLAHLCKPLCHKQQL